LGFPLGGVLDFLSPDTSAGFADEIIVIEDGQTHSHGPEGEHSHNVTASVTWLDLGLHGR